MNRPWMVWSPGPNSTRVMVTSDEEILLKARLSPVPGHPRAAQWLMEAIALWEGAPVRAVISASDARASYASHFWDAAIDLGGPLYSLRLAGSERVVGRQLNFFDERVAGIEGFSDLETAVVSEALGGDQ